MAIDSETLQFSSEAEAKELLKILFEYYPTTADHAEESYTDNFCLLPMEEGIHGQRFYIPALYEVLCLENPSVVTELKKNAGFRRWGAMKSIEVDAMLYEHKHKKRRWVMFGVLDGSMSTKLPYVPADLIVGTCNGENIKLPPWVRRSQNRDVNDLKTRLSLRNANQGGITHLATASTDINIRNCSSPVDHSSPPKMQSPINSSSKEIQNSNALIDKTSIISTSGQKSTNNFVSPTMKNVPCRGLKRRVAEFANISDANTGICIKLFDFNKRRKIWTSDGCLGSVDIDGKNCCSSCEKLNLQIRRRSAKYGVVTIDKKEPKSSNLLPSTESISNFIANQYKDFDSDESFLNDESVILHAKVLSSMGYNGRISLGMNKYFGSCKGNSPSCSCFHVWEILRFGKNIDYCPQCSSENKKNRRSEQRKKDKRKA